MNEEMLDLLEWCYPLALAEADHSMGGSPEAIGLWAKVEQIETILRKAGREAIR